MTGQNEKTDFSNGKIYVIISPNHDLCYYGSTVYTIEQRFSKHKAKSSKCTSKQIINAGNAKIFEIEKYPCSTLEQLEDREAHFIVTDWDGCVNKEVPGAIRRAGGIKVYMKKYEATPERKAKQKDYRNEKIPCNICGCMTMRKNKARHQTSKTCQKYLKNELGNLMNDIITQIEQQ